ncbi:MAG: hypothetical protein RIE32_00210 [Phycisphaerales bacterium]
MNQTPSPHADEPLVAATLTERLTCVACGYDLRGLSVLDRCPECGLRIATSILAIVDPRAQEFEPIRRPRHTAIGLMVWSISGLLAAACAWLLRAAELPALRNDPHLIAPDTARIIAIVGAGLILLSGVGAIALVRPARSMPPRGVRMAMIGVALYLPLAAAFWYLHAHIDSSAASPYFERLPDVNRVLARAVELGLITCVVLLLRTNARSLAARSAILRTGRVDRQTLYAVALAAGIGIAGDLVRLAATSVDGVLADVLSIAGVSIVVIASALLTMGLAGATLDCARIARALWRSGRRITSLVSMVDVARAERTGNAPS